MNGVDVDHLAPSAKHLVGGAPESLAELAVAELPELELVEIDGRIDLVELLVEERGGVPNASGHGTLVDGLKG